MPQPGTGAPAPTHPFFLKQAFSACSCGFHGPSQASGEDRGQEERPAVVSRSSLCREDPSSPPPFPAPFSPLLLTPNLQHLCGCGPLPLEEGSLGQPQDKPTRRALPAGPGVPWPQRGRVPSHPVTHWVVSTPLGTLEQAERYRNVTPPSATAPAVGPGECPTFFPLEEPFLNSAHQPRKGGARKCPPRARAPARVQGGLSSRLWKGAPREGGKGKKQKKSPLATEKESKRLINKLHTLYIYNNI